MTSLEGLRLTFLILGAIYGLGVLVYRAYVWRKVQSVDDRVCELCDEVRESISSRGASEPDPGFTRVSREESSQGSDEVPFPDGQEPHDVNSWVSQLEGREL